MGGEVGNLPPYIQTMLDGLAYPVAWVGGDGRYRLANHAYAVRHDLEVGNLIGARFRDVVGEEYYSELAPKIAAALAGEPVEFEVSRRGGGDGDVFVRVHLVPNVGDDGTVDGVFIIGDDVTEFRLRDLALRRSEAKFATLFERMIDGCAIHEMICDADGKPVDYRFVDVNPAFERMTGLRREDVVGKTVLEVLPATEPEWIAQYGHVAATGEPVQFEAFSKALGRHFSVSAFSTEFGTFAATFSDVTDERAAEDARMQLQRIVERSPAISFLWRNAADWPVEYVSNNIALFGYTPDDFLSARVKFADIVHADDISRVAAEVERYGASDADEFKQEYRLRTGAGAYIWVEDHTWIRRAEDGSISHFQGILLDITEKKAFETELREAKVDAERANQAKSAFLAAMSHDLRTPLNAIMGFSDMMRNHTFGALGDEHYERYADDIHRSGQLLISLINDILDLSKIEAQKYDVSEGRIDLPALIDECVLQNGPASDRKSQVVTLDVPDGLPALKGDERAIMQILNNLLSNAIKFSADDGAIAIKVAVDADGRIGVSVADNGIGISKQDLARIAKPFAQADGKHVRRHEGTGLGLYLVDSLMKLHGGTMRVDSAKGEGTTVTVTFPAERTLAPS